VSDADVAVLRDPDVVAAALSPARRAVLAALDEPRSATEIARRLGLPRQQVGYHVRELERLGLVELVDERRRRGFTERILRRRPHLVVDPGIAADDLRRRPGGPGAVAAVAAATDVIRTVPAAVDAARRDGRPAPTATLDADLRVASPAALRDFLTELAELVARHDRTDDPGALPVRFVGIVHPGAADP
jgi:DNA-binding transcriptional ArsR family regulator